MQTNRRVYGSRGTIGSVVVLAAIVAGMSACSRSRTTPPAADSLGPAATAAVVRVVRKDLSNDLQIASEFLPYQEIDVHAKVSGYIKQLNINWGTHVKQGQLLAVLEVPELDAQVARDEAACRESKQALARAKEELARAQYAYTVAHLTYSRMAGVQKTQPGLVAQEEVDVAHGKDMETFAAVSAARDAIGAAEEELAASRSTLQRDKDLVNYSRITAPFDGVVTKLYAYAGALLPAGTSTSSNGLALCHLAQNDLLRLVIPVPSKLVPDVHVGEAVRVSVPSLDREFQGKLTRFSDQIDLQTRTMRVEVDVPNPSYTLVPGMYAYVKIPVKSAENALTVPVQALTRSGQDRGTVFVVNGEDTIEPRTVTLGLETPSVVQVLSGVQAGEPVVFGDLNRYHAGEKVRPRPVKLASLMGKRL